MALGYPSDDNSNGNPLLAEYNRTGVVPPALQPVLERVKQKIQALGSPIGQEMPPGGQPARPTPTLAPPGTAPPPVTGTVSRGTSGPPAPSAAPAALSSGSPTLTPAQQEYARLTHTPTPGEEHTKADTGSAGENQIHNPWARNTIKVLDAIGSQFFPGLAMGIPGTQLHHNQLVRQAAGNVNEEQNVAKDEATTHHLNAEAAEQESLPEFHQAQNDVKRLQAENKAQADAANVAERGAYHEGQKTAREQAQEINDLKAGYRRNAEGELEVIPYEEMTPEQQVTHDVKSSQREMMDATAQLRRAQAEKNPQNEQLARQRLDIANRRLALSQATYNARYLGTGTDNKPLPGALLTDDNRAVGSANAANVRPTGTQRTRGDLAGSGEEQLNDMRAIVNKHPEFFGPGAGRATEFKKWIGSQDPEAQRFLTASEILADHAAGVFGARAASTIAAQKIASGELKDNPPAIDAALGQVEKAMKNIGSHGTPKTVGSNAVEHPPQDRGQNDPRYQVNHLYGGKTYLGGDVNKAENWK